MVWSADAAGVPIFEDYHAIETWPWSVMVFVTEARRIIGYLKHLPGEQRPPRSIWHSPKKCDKWIEDHNPYKDENKKSPGNAIPLHDLDVERE